MGDRSADEPQGLPLAAAGNARRRRFRAAATLMAVLAIAASAAAGAQPLGPNWRRCAMGAGGAFNLSVHRLTCTYATRVTEDGLFPDTRRTRAGGFTCQRREVAHRLWSYSCQRAQGRQALSFETYRSPQDCMPWC